MHYSAQAHSKGNKGKESQRLKSESHSNKLHSISPSSLPVLGSLFCLDVCFIFLLFRCISSLTLYLFRCHDWAPPPFWYVSKISLWTSVSTPLFSISCFYSLPCFPYFPSLPMWDGAFSLASELHKWHWRRVGVRLHVSHPCVSESHLTVWLHSKQYSAAESFHQTLCDPGVNTWFQAIFQLTVLFCCFFSLALIPFHTCPNGWREKKKYLNRNPYEMIIVIVVATYLWFIPTEDAQSNCSEIKIDLMSSVSVLFNPCSLNY